MVYGTWKDGTVPSGCSDALAGGGRSDCGARLRWTSSMEGEEVRANGVKVSNVLEYE
jgi:hypothetical protein